MLEELSIVPSKGKKSLVHGYMGITPTVTISGLVQFNLTKSTSITSVKVILNGSSTIAAGSGSLAPRIANRKLLMNEVVLLPADGVSGGDKKKGVLLGSGGHEFPFDLYLAEGVVQVLPPSTDYMRHVEGYLQGLKVEYTVKAIVETAPTIFGPGKSEDTEELGLNLADWGDKF